MIDLALVHTMKSFCRCVIINAVFPSSTTDAIEIVSSENNQEIGIFTRPFHRYHVKSSWYLFRLILKKFLTSTNMFLNISINPVNISYNFFF